MLDSGKDLNSSDKVGLFRQSLIHIILSNQFFFITENGRVEDSEPEMEFIIPEGIFFTFRLSLIKLNHGR